MKVSCNSGLCVAEWAHHPYLKPFQAPALSTAVFAHPTRYLSIKAVAGGGGRAQRILSARGRCSLADTAPGAPAGGHAGAGARLAGPRWRLRQVLRLIPCSVHPALCTGWLTVRIPIRSLDPDSCTCISVLLLPQLLSGRWGCRPQTAANLACRWAVVNHRPRVLQVQGPRASGGGVRVAASSQFRRSGPRCQPAVQRDAAAAVAAGRLCRSAAGAALRMKS